MICLNCGREIMDNSKFCEFCGKKVEKKNFKRFICNGCGKEIDDNSNFCEFCGKKVEKNIVNNIFCTKCGSRLDGGNFCTVCGTRVNQISSISSKDEFLTNENDNEIIIKEEKVEVAEEDTQEEKEEIVEENTQEEKVEIAEEDTQEEKNVVDKDENTGDIYCTNCGSKIVGGNFCIGCGTKINSNQSIDEVINKDYKKMDKNEIVNKEGKDIILNVTRKKKTMGFAVPFTVLVDGEKIGKLKNGMTVTCNIKPGHHTVNIESVEKNTIQEIDVDDSTNSVEIVVVAKMGFVAATAKLVDVIYK